MNAQMVETYRILDEAFDTYKPSTVIASFSGGYDSMVTAHIALQWAAERRKHIKVIAVDTLISADGWRDFVTKAAYSIGSNDFQIWNNPGLDAWINDVKVKGFVYRKKQHPFYFYYLKQRAFREQLAAFKTSRHDHVMFLEGIRRAESIDRRKAPEVEVKGSGVFVNPILYWQDGEIDQYRADYGFPVNPFYDTVGNSGDCMCNWHNRISLAQLEKSATQALKIIIPLDVECRVNFGYGYQGEPSHSPEDNGQLRLFDWDTDCTPDLCAGCSKPEPTNDLRDFAQLQRMEW